MLKQQPLIIFGGTFDPIHNGHIKIANRVWEQFQSPITFMPTAIPNYKAKPLATNQQRLDMLQLSIGNNQHFLVSRFEINQSNYSPSYKTLSYFRNILDASTPIYYVIGEDSLVSLHTWDSWKELFNLTNFIVLRRPGYSYTMMNKELKKIFEEKKTSNCKDLTSAYGKIYLLDFELSDISSTNIRKSIKLNLDIKEYLPINVANYIFEHNIYKE